MLVRCQLKCGSSQGMSMEARLLSMSEVADRAGLTSAALRYYERSGLIRPRTRVGGRRHYDASVLQTLAIIALLQEVGFTIGEIKTAMGGKRGRERWRDLAREKLQQIDDHIEKVATARELLAAALDCRCSSLETCDLVQQRRGRHRKTIQRVGFGTGGLRPS